jgi:hypothetical protein
MTTIIRSNLIISGTYKLTDATQVASGVKITVLPGATLDLGGFSLLNYGTISLEGDATKFAIIQNGEYSTNSTSGSFNTNYGNVKNLIVDGFFSKGTLQITNSLVEDSKIDALESNSISKSIFKSSPLDFGIESATIDQVTFSDSQISKNAWVFSPFSSSLVVISNSNLVGTSPVIFLDPFFSGDGYSHSIKITNSYIRTPSGSNFESMVYDATDDLKVTTDLVSSGFLTTPITNGSAGFTVGSYTYPLAQLLSTSTPQAVKYETHTLSVIVDKGVLGTGAVLLKGLTEKLTITNGVATTHTVDYAGSTFDYNQIDTLITTVIRDGEFTNEFKKELTDAAPTTANLTYKDAVTLVGVLNIDAALISVAGLDGNFVA